MLKVYERVIRWLPARLQWLVDAASVGEFSGVVEVRTVFLSTRTVVRITHPFHVVRKERGDRHALVSNLAKSYFCYSSSEGSRRCDGFDILPEHLRFKGSTCSQFNSIEFNSIEFNSVDFNSFRPPTGSAPLVRLPPVRPRLVRPPPVGAEPVGGEPTGAEPPRTERVGPNRLGPNRSFVGPGIRGFGSPGL